MSNWWENDPIVAPPVVVPPAPSTAPRERRQMAPPVPPSDPAPNWWENDPIVPEGPTMVAQTRADIDRMRRGEPIEQPPMPEGMAGTIDSATRGMAMGWGQEATGLEAAILGRTPEGGYFDYSQPFGERYQRAFEAEKQQQDRFAEQHPYIDTAAELGGALATGMGAGRAGLTLAGKAATTTGAVGYGALEGAGYGALYGAGSADQGERLAGAFEGGAAGAAAGGVFGGIADKLTRSAGARAAAKAAPSNSQIRRGAQTAYDAARARNPVMPGYQTFAGSARPTLANEGFHPRLHPKVATALGELEKLAKTGADPDFTTIEKMRRIIGSAASSIDPDERRLGKMLRDGLDTFVEVSAPVPEVKVGRELWQRLKKSELIDELVEKAGNRAASTGSGGNVENATRQNLRRILDNPKLRRGFNGDEIKAIEAIVRGTPAQDALRLIGKLSPSGNGLMAALGLGATVANPLLAAAPAAGIVAKKLADRGTQRGVERLSTMVRTGAQIPQQPMSPLVSGATRGAAGYAGGQRPVQFMDQQKQGVIDLLQKQATSGQPPTPEMLALARALAGPAQDEWQPTPNWRPATAGR